MIHVSFEVNGREVNPRDFGHALERAALEEITKDINRRVGSVRCRTHGQSPRIVAKGRSVDKLTFDVHGCCDEVVEQVKAKLG